MKQSNQMRDFATIHAMLCYMGAGIHCIGTFQTAYAVCLVRNQPEKMMLATKQLYPAVAKHYGTSWKTVERNIRYTITRIWKYNPKLSGRVKKPKPMEFIVNLACISASPNTYVW
ncbi:MAG: sporulation initiation factor Spo0A C-terminal domain-containing protein [Eubacteriales bacterium]|nr:sporulation initiation factor Spo0A C-terminal domain-containing protein [Eubacteriales bacterium]